MAFCEYPVPNPFASAVEPKLCGKADYTMMSAVPYQASQMGEVEIRIQPLCLKHSTQIAAFRFAQSVCHEPFTDAEIIFLHDQGFDVLELVEPDRWHGPKLLPDHPDS